MNLRKLSRILKRPKERPGKLACFSYQAQVKELLALAGIKSNDLLDISVIDGNIVLKKIENRHKTLEERAKEYGGKLGPYEEYDWGEPVGRERWQ